MEEFKTFEGDLIEFGTKTYWNYDYSKDKFVQVKIKLIKAYCGEDLAYIADSSYCGKLPNELKNEVFSNKNNCMKSTAKELQKEAQHYKKLMDQCNERAEKMRKCVE